MEPLINLNNSPTVINRGVVFLRDANNNVDKTKPVYIVEHFTDKSGMETVTVYNATLDANKKPMKAKTQVTKSKNVFNPVTSLATVASHLFKKEEKIQYVDRAPIFMDLVYTSIDTFTKKQEKGFFERSQDSITLNGVKEGQRSGVFIGFSSVEWLPPIVDLKDTIRQHQINQSIWLKGD